VITSPCWIFVLMFFHEGRCSAMYEAEGLHICCLLWPIATRCMLLVSCNEYYSFAVLYIVAPTTCSLLHTYVTRVDVVLQSRLRISFPARLERLAIHVSHLLFRELFQSLLDDAIAPATENDSIGSNQPTTRTVPPHTPSCRNVFASRAT
jgi:hypothetical protein